MMSSRNDSQDDRYSDDPKRRATAPTGHNGDDGYPEEARQSASAEASRTGDPDLDPFEIEFLPQFREGRGPRAPFVNEYGVVIGDHDYESAHSPLERWDEETDPFVMAGEQWVHPYKDVGFQSRENRDYFEKGIPPQGGVFMHPAINVGYGAVAQGTDGIAGTAPDEEEADD